MNIKKILKEIHKTEKKVSFEAADYLREELMLDYMVEATNSIDKKMAKDAKKILEGMGFVLLDDKKKENKTSIITWILAGIAGLATCWWLVMAIILFAKGIWHF